LSIFRKINKFQIVGVNEPTSREKRSDGSGGLNIFCISWIKILCPGLDLWVSEVMEAENGDYSIITIKIMLKCCGNDLPWHFHFARRFNNGKEK